MAISVTHRWIGYLIAFAATLAAMTWAGGQDHGEPAVAPAQAIQRDAHASEAATPPAALEIALDKLARRAAPTSAGDPFQARSWEEMKQAEARKNVRPPPPPPPQAPPLPFAYMGKLVEDDAMVVFLTKQDRNYIVRAGDTLDGTYGVEAIEEDRLVLNYLPLGIRQTLSFAANSAPVTAPSAAQSAPLPVNLPQTGVRSRGQARDDEDD